MGLVPIFIWGDNILLVWCVLLIMWLLNVYFLENNNGLHKALFGCYVLGHCFLVNFLGCLQMFIILSPMDIDQNVLCEQKMSIN